MPAQARRIDKVIVSNLSELSKKYGATGVQQVNAAINKLIAADQNRGLETKFIALDDATTMKQFGVQPVSQASDPKQNKDAIDAIYKAYAPDYLLLLGAIDIIPHQNLKNLLFTSDPNGDVDKFANGDLPYACEAKYSQNIKNFLGPTRVVGRLPDITAGNDVKYLLKLLEHAEHFKENDADLYNPYFGISTQTWKQSTALSLKKTFGNAKDLKIVPPNNSNWPSPLVTRLAHFINCHGGLDTSQFYGESTSGNDYPVSLDAAYLEKNISTGTVVSAECCYGGQLFDPARNTVQTGQMGIANAYLAKGAYGVFASTTIAYGPSDGNDSADLICQYFLQKVLQGASLGRALLEARQKFLHTADMADPFNLKTIAQFNLYADPAVTPVTGVSKPKQLSKGLVAQQSLSRSERRRDLFSRGLALAKSQPIISKVAGDVITPLKGTMSRLAADNGIILTKDILTFEVTPPAIAKSMPMALFAKEIFSDRIHVIFGTTAKELPKTPKAKRLTSPQVPNVVDLVALIAKEVAGNIVSVRKVFSR